jgi:hypothetical protein
MHEITENALIKRINRKLEKEGLKLKKVALRFRSGYGEWMIVDELSNTVTAYHIEPDKLAGELGVL